MTLFFPPNRPAHLMERRFFIDMAHKWIIIKNGCSSSFHKTFYTEGKLSAETVFAPEGTPEGIKIIHRSGTLGVDDIRATNIRNRRIRNNWTQYELSERTEMASLTTQRIYRIENGNTVPNVNEIQRLAETLGCTVRNLETKEPRQKLTKRPR